MMRSRTARLSLCALAWIALSVGAAYTRHTQSRIAERRAALRSFEVSARDAADALHDVRLNAEARISAYTVESENFESIHNHSAYALIEWVK